MSFVKDAHKQPGILENKTSWQSGQGFASTDNAHINGLEGGNDLGMLIERTDSTRAIRYRHGRIGALDS
jgi:hypothetical protein